MVWWKDWDALCEFAATMEDKPLHIVGEIDAETAKKRLDCDLGELFVVAGEGGFVICIEGGVVVVF